jgi:hypothetical protein
MYVAHHKLGNLARGQSLYIFFYETGGGVKSPTDYTYWKNKYKKKSYKEDQEIKKS